MQALLKKLSPGLRCEIIVSADPSAQRLLDEFIEGKVDVAIVKQMGAVGLDVDHMKVALDLSNTRTRAYFHQRMMRVATRWDVPRYPGKPVTESVYIAPDDRITRELVEATLEGTGLLRVVIEGKQLPLGGPTIDVPPIGWPEPTFTPVEVVLTGELQDSYGVKAPAEYIPVADSFSEEFPVAGDISKPKLINWLKRVGVDPGVKIGIPTEDATVPVVETPDQDGGAVLDITKALNDVRQKVHQAGKRAINARFKREYGNYDKTLAREYSALARRFWSEHFALVGFPRDAKLKAIDDVGTLETIHANIKRELKEGGP